MSTTYKTDVKEHENTSFFQQHWQKLIGLAFWLAAAGGYFWYANANDLTPLEVIQQLADLFRSPLGPVIFIVLYALRPIIFFPATLITLAGGSIFGPILGIIYVVIGSNASASVAYLIGRYFGEGVLEEDGSDGIIQRYAQRMRQNSFETVLIMRFIYLPYDLVNYLGGFLKINYKPFILATILGSIPGTISFVLFGASLDISEGIGNAELNPWALAASVAIFIVSLGLSRYFKSRENSEEAAEAK